MKTEETKYQATGIYEETKVYGNAENKGGDKEAASGKKSTWKQVMIGGVSGIFLGAAGTLFTSSASAEDVAETGAGEQHAEGGHEAGTPISPDTAATTDSLPVATVSDDMSFGEAFAAAREQVGAGGVFEWHGGIYGTYYADEWNAMSPEERAEFGSHVNYAGGSAHTAEAEPEPEVDVQPEVNVHANETPDVAVVEPEPQPADDEVQILGVETVEVDDGANVTMGYAEVNGEEVFVVDVDQDGEFDRMAMDANHDGELSSNEIVNIEGQGIMVSDWEQPAQAPDPNDVYLADNDMPDYTNDADVNSFA